MPRTAGQVMNRMYRKSKAIRTGKRKSQRYKTGYKKNKMQSQISTNTQLINPGRDRIYYAKRTYSQNLVSGTGNPVSAILQWYITQFPEIGSFSVLFNQYKCVKLVYTFTLKTISNIDDELVPEIYIRYNDDPDLTTTSISQMMQQRGTLRHQFTGTDLQVTYTVYPKIMMAAQIYQSTTLQAVPRKAGWQDIDKTIGHYGLQYYIPSLPTGQKIEVNLTASVAFKEAW